MKVTGRATVRYNNEVILSASGASINIGGEMRDPQPTDQGKIGHSSKIEQAEVVVPAIHTPDLDLVGIRAFEDGVVEFVTDTGVSWVINGAYFATMGALANGRVNITFQGDPAVVAST